MAEDRMLSDEILLGLIKANSGGGGGGGTTNYNQLENKPQIGGVTLTGNKTASDLGLVAAEAGKGLSSNNYTDADKAIVGGVTAALADKADKSAVKNEFIGTLDEWNALTIEQRKAYDTYQIKGDYTEGSGGLPDYSTTEQKTGQKWIDGKDVYFKTIEYGALPNNTYKDVSSGLSNVNILEIKAFCDDGANFLTIPRPAIDNNYAIELSYNYSLNSVRIATKVNMTSYNATAILYYTKTA